MAEVLWQEGDGWVDLAPAMISAGEVSVVSEQGTVRLLRWAAAPAWGARGARLPLEGGHRMLWDGAWGRLDLMRASPCGMRVEAPDGGLWEESTPLRLLLRGLHPGWLELPEARTTAQRVFDREPVPVPSGHPYERCRALYCCLDPRAADHWA